MIPLLLEHNRFLVEMQGEPAVEFKFGITPEALGDIHSHLGELWLVENLALLSLLDSLHEYKPESWTDLEFVTAYF
jgi:hypothetical protein